MDLSSAPIGTKAPSMWGGYWIKTEKGWKWFCGNTFPRPGADWNGKLIYPEKKEKKNETFTDD